VQPIMCTTTPPHHMITLKQSTNDLREASCKVLDILLTGLQVPQRRTEQPPSTARHPTAPLQTQDPGVHEAVHTGR